MLTGLEQPQMLNGQSMPSVNYQLTDNFNVTAGVQNLFDTEALKIDGSAGAKGEGVPRQCSRRNIL